MEEDGKSPAAVTEAKTSAVREFVCSAL
jgi:hypothetical protein